MAKKKKKQFTEEEIRLIRQLVEVDDKATEKNLKKKVVSKSSKKEKKRPSGVEAELKKADRTEKNLQKRRDLKSERNPKSKRNPAYFGRGSLLGNPGEKREFKSFKELGKALKNKKKLNKEDKKKALKLLDDAIKGKVEGLKEEKRSSPFDIAEYWMKKGKLKKVDPNAKAKPKDKPKANKNKLAKTLPEKKSEKPVQKKPVNEAKNKALSDGVINSQAFNPGAVRGKTAKKIIGDASQQKNFQTADTNNQGSLPSRYQSKPGMLKEQTNQYPPPMGNKIELGKVGNEILSAGTALGLYALQPKSKDVKPTKVGKTNIGSASQAKTFTNEAKTGQVQNVQAQKLNPNQYQAKKPPGASGQSALNTVQTLQNQKDIEDTKGNIKDVFGKLKPFADQANQQAQRLFESGLEKTEAMENIFDKQLPEIQARIKETLNMGRKATERVDALVSQGIDPSRYFKSMDTFQAAMTAISIGLGAYSSARLGRTNTALKMLNDAINRDIKIQVQEYKGKIKKGDNRINLFKTNLKMLQDERKALLQTVADMGSAMKTKLSLLSESLKGQKGYQEFQELQLKFFDAFERKRNNLSKENVDMLKVQYGFSSKEADRKLRADEKSAELDLDAKKVNQKTQLERVKEENKRKQKNIEQKNKQSQFNVGEKNRVKIEQGKLTSKQKIAQGQITSRERISDAANSLKAKLQASKISVDVWKFLKGQGFKERQLDHQKDVQLMKHLERQRQFDVNNDLNQRKFQQTLREHGLNEYQKDFDNIMKEKDFELKEKKFKALQERIKKEQDQKAMEFNKKHDLNLKKHEAKLKEDLRKGKIDQDEFDLKLSKFKFDKLTDKRDFKEKQRQFNKKLESGVFERNQLKLQKEKSEQEYLQETPVKNLIKFSIPKEGSKITPNFKTTKDYVKFRSTEQGVNKGILALNRIINKTETLLGADFSEFLAKKLLQKTPLIGKEVKEIVASMRADYKEAMLAKKDSGGLSGVLSDKDLELLIEVVSGGATDPAKAWDRADVIARLEVVKRNFIQNIQARNNLIKTHFSGDLDSALIKVKQDEDGQYVPDKYIKALERYNKR